MPPNRGLVLTTVLLALCSCAGPRRTTTSLPPVPPDGPRLAIEVRLTAWGSQVTGKITALSGDSVTVLSAPYWGEEPRTYPLDAITAVEVTRKGGGGPGFVYGFAFGFIVTGVRAATSAEYNEDYSEGLFASLGNGLMIGTLTSRVGSLIRPQVTIYDLRRMSPENRLELVRRLMAEGGAAPTEEESWSPAGGPR